MGTPQAAQQAPKSNADRTPLHWAVINGNLEEVQRLLDDGADVRAQDLRGDTSLHFAAERSLCDIAKILIAKGADVKALGAAGNTPLHLAALGQHLRATSRAHVVTLLLNHGADPNAKNSPHGSTPLHYAAWNGFSKVVEILLANKADFVIERKDGKTSEMIASERGHNDVAHMLRMAGVRAGQVAKESTPMRPGGCSTPPQGEALQQ